jgi:hypothetical protein
MSTNKEIFDQFTNTIVPELQKVSGSFFGKSIEVESNENSMTIYASPFISVLWNGRKPTSFGAKSGNPTLQKSILSWINNKGIGGKANKDGKIPTSEQLSWAISKSIHLNGTKLYQEIKAGRQPKNIFDTILTSNRIDNLLSLIGQRYFVQITNIVKQ